jgi:hypothetical protein
MSIWQQSETMSQAGSAFDDNPKLPKATEYGA